MKQKHIGALCDALSVSSCIVNGIVFIC